MAEISDKVLHYGMFKETLDKVVDLMNSEYPCSVIIRGNPGSGKKTLIEEAVRLTNVVCVTVPPEHYSDDYVAIKAIAAELSPGIKSASISDLMREIRDYASKKKKKLVIVLYDFEDLCSQRQSLLYNLMNLMHQSTDSDQIDSGPNLTLIGLTSNLEWAENLEKRVRSRLNAKCIELKLPYTRVEEYIEFAWLLMEKIRINDELVEQLEYMYSFTNRSIRTLKKYLIKICDVDEKGRLINNFDPNDYRNDYLILPNILFREQLRFLTKPQLDLLKCAVYYCYKMQETNFSLSRMASKDFMSKWKVDFTSSQVLRDTSLLVRLRLFQPESADQIIGMEATLYPATVAKQFKAVIEGDHSLHNAQTDQLWRSLR